MDAVRCRIVLETPPAGVDYGLQKGHGSAFETVQTQRSDGRDLQFEFTAEVRAGSAADLRGPFIQGPAGRAVRLHRHRDDCGSGWHALEPPAEGSVDRHHARP